MHRPLIRPKSDDTPALYSPTLVGTTYAHIRQRRDAVGSALLALEREGRLRRKDVDAGVASPPELTCEGIPRYGDTNRAKDGARRGWAIGLWSQNREEWQIVDLAAQAYGLVTTSLYETLGPDVAEYMWVKPENTDRSALIAVQYQSLSALDHLCISKSPLLSTQARFEVPQLEGDCDLGPARSSRAGPPRSVGR